MTQRTARGTDDANADARALEGRIEAAFQQLHALLADPLPNCAPLPGCVVAQYRRAGERRHGPYWFRVWRDEAGRQRKRYVPAEQLEAARAACALHRRLARMAGRGHGRSIRRWSKGYLRMVDALCVLVDRERPRACSPDVRTKIEASGARTTGRTDGIQVSDASDASGSGTARSAGQGLPERTPVADARVRLGQE